MAALSSVLAGVPVEIGRDAARARARAELARPEYAEQGPSLTQRVIDAVIGFFRDLLDAAGQASPGGYLGLLVLVALIVLAVVAIRLKVGPLARERGAEGALFVGRIRSAAEHRAAAEEHAAAGRWDEALRERLRAVIRGLEERGLIDARPGRTADEAARDGGVALPSCAAGLQAAARSFDEVWYGERPGTRERYEAVAALDADVARARPAGGSGVPAMGAAAATGSGDRSPWTEAPR
jgi:hypothetical protein